LGRRHLEAERRLHALTVSSGQTSVGVVVLDGGVEIVESAGAASDTTVGSGRHPELIGRRRAGRDDDVLSGGCRGGLPATR
jgi:autotransporter passenger strand-loop-strand repeat protein